ncbi:hypothetical protein ACFQZC_38500 [Streptacidiphilus monticola]
MIVIEPDGKAQAWPVYDQPDLFLELGNVLTEPVSTIWERYPYKHNHLRKYLGKSIWTAANAGTAPMHEATSLLWPEGPYAAERRPFGHPQRLLTAISLLWADDGDRAVPSATARCSSPSTAPRACSWTRTPSTSATARWSPRPPTTTRP